MYGGMASAKFCERIKGVLGLTEYYRRFIKGYGTISKPRTKLLNKNGFIRPVTAQAAFERLKTGMVTALVLKLPNFKQEFIVEVDASNQGIGAVLSQAGRPIAYFSKALSLRHQTLSVYEKEMLAVLVAVKRWTTYLLRRSFKIKIDHQSLKFLLDQKTTTSTQQQWVLKMMGYDYEVVYRKKLFQYGG